MMKPEMIAASRIPDPVAESQFKPNTAPSAVGFTTTGGTRWTNLSRPVTGICGFVILLGAVDHVLIDGNTFSGVFMIFLPVFVPQQKTQTLRISHGSQARSHLATAVTVSPRAARCSSSWCPSCPQIVLGCQTFRNRMRHAIEMKAATMSVSHGPCKFEIRDIAELRT